MQLPATYPLRWVRGATADFGFRFTDTNGDIVGGPGFNVRMQVRTMAGQYGTSTTDTLVLELSTEGVDPLLSWEEIDGKYAVVASLRPDQHATLNPNNDRRAVYAYSVEIYSDVSGGEYVAQPLRGKLTVEGETTR